MQMVIAVARHLDAHPKIKKGHYPGLGLTPAHDMRGKHSAVPGAMLAFDLGRRIGARFLIKLNWWLAGLESRLRRNMISLPALMTHASMPFGFANSLALPSPGAAVLGIKCR